MKKIITMILAYALAFDLMGQTVVAEKEILGTIGIGKGPSQIRYLSTEEGFYSPGGIFVDSNGGLFFIQNFKDRPIIIFNKGEFTEKPIPGNLPDTWYGPSSFGVSQSGVSFSGSLFFSLENGTVYRQTDVYDSKYMNPTMANGYPTPWGAVWESVDHRQLISASFRLGEAAQLRSQVETKSWLPTQSGGFTLGKDGLLYRNGMLWSAVRPKGKENYDFRYLGRIMSGHTVWCPGPPEVSSDFYIVDARGNIELEVKIPGETRFNYGLGPWGEFYYLFAPPMDKRLDPMNDYYKPEPGMPAELDVFRTHLKYFGRLNDSNVRLRKDPSTTADILGTYPAKTGFRIIEKGTKQESIGGKTDYWYHVRLLDGKEGWFFGSFVANLYDGPGTPPPWPNVADW